jgi:hypothetical protein
MLTMPAVPDEPLVDYFMRVLDRVRETAQPLTCEHRDRVFVVHSGMTTSELVRAWHEGARADGHESAHYES